MPIEESTCIHCTRDIVLEQSVTPFGNIWRAWRTVEHVPGIQRSQCDERPIWQPADENDPDGPQSVTGYNEHEPKG